MTEREKRLEEALEVAKKALADLSGCEVRSYSSQRCRAAMDDIAAVLDPSPEMETVTEDVWRVDTETGGVWYYPCEQTGAHRQTKGTCTFQRPVPRPVERSVSATVKVRSAFANRTWIEIPFNEEFPMAGTQVVVAWTETPKGE